MELKSLISRKRRGKKGEGRKVNFTPINVPVDVAEDIKLYRLIYADKLGDKVSFESMLRRWFTMVAEQEPDIQATFDFVKKQREIYKDKEASRLGVSAEQLAANHRNFNPADPELKPWELSYMFIRNEKETEALPDDKGGFYAVVDGRNIGMSAMLSDGWILINEVGSEISWSQAFEINRLMKEHKDKDMRDQVKRIHGAVLAEKEKSLPSHQK